MKNDFTIVGDVALIHFSNGDSCRVDVTDLPKLMEHPGTWGAVLFGHLKYARVHAQRGHAGGLMHRIIMGAKPGEVVDHVEHDGLDNRRANLRIATHAQNMQNRPGPNRGSTSGIRGVTWNKRLGKWQAQVTVNRKNHNLGQFAEIADAEAAAIAGRARLMTHSIY